MELAQALRNLIEAIFKVILPVISEGAMPAALKSTFFLTKSLEKIVSKLQFEAEGLGALETDFQLFIVNRALAAASGILNSQESVLLRWSHTVMSDKVCEALEIQDWMQLYAVWQAKIRDARKFGLRHEAKKKDKATNKSFIAKPNIGKGKKSAVIPNPSEAPTQLTVPSTPRPCFRSMLVHFNAPGAQSCTVSKCRFSHDISGFSNDQLRAALSTIKDGTNKTFLLTAIPP
jgi:hypothetical protein